MMLMLIAQVAAAAADPGLAPPDIAFNARVQAREVRVEQRGEASLEVSGGPGSGVRVDKPRGDARGRLRNVDIRVEAEARVAAPEVSVRATAEASPQ